MYALFLGPLLLGLVWVLAAMPAQILVRCYVHHYVYCLLAVFVFTSDPWYPLVPFLLHASAIMFLYRMAEFLPIQLRYISYLLITFVGIITCSFLVILLFSELLEPVRISTKAPYFMGTQSQMKDFLAFICYWIFQLFRYLIEEIIKSLLKFLKSKFK
jgi:hypothetical protein